MAKERTATTDTWVKASTQPLDRREKMPVRTMCRPQRAEQARVWLSPRFQPPPAAAGLVHQQVQAGGGHQGAGGMGQPGPVAQQHADGGGEQHVEAGDEAGLGGAGEAQPVRLQPEHGRDHQAQPEAVGQRRPAHGHPPPGDQERPGRRRRWRTGR